jgi:hypothetical protein
MGKTSSSFVRLTLIASAALFALHANAAAPKRAHDLDGVRAELGKPATRRFPYKKVVITSAPGGGNGNDAAMWITARDLAGRFGASVTLVPGGRGWRVLSRLTGLDATEEPTIVVGKGKVRVGLRPKTAPADLVIHLGGWGGPITTPDGKIQPRYLSTREEPSREDLIPVDAHTVVAALPLFFSEAGLREVHGSARGAIVRGNTARDIAGAGLAANRAGVYVDPIALSLRDSAPSAVRDYALQALNDIPSKKTRGALVGLLQGRKLRGAIFGLAYGLGSADQAQVEAYTEGLVSDARRRGVSYVVVTPSRVSDEVKRHVRYLRATDDISKHAEPGQVYVVEVETLPHRAFVSLMAASQIPPIVSGDSATSAALGLGKPFALTKVVGQNEMNITALRERLMREAKPDEASLLGRLFPDGDQAPDLSKVLELSTSAYQQAFHRASGKVGSLTDHILRSADDLRGETE